MPRDVRKGWSRKRAACNSHAVASLVAGAGGEAWEGGAQAAAIHLARDALACQVSKGGRHVNVEGDGGGGGAGWNARASHKHGNSNVSVIWLPFVQGQAKLQAGVGGWSVSASEAAGWQEGRQPLLALEYLSKMITMVCMGEGLHAIIE